MRLGTTFLDHWLLANIVYVFYSEFIQVLKRLLKLGHDCQNAECPSIMFTQAVSEFECIPAPQGLQLVENHENCASLDKKALKNRLCLDSNLIHAKVKEGLEQKPGKILDEPLIEVAVVLLWVDTHVTVGLPIASFTRDLKTIRPKT